MRTSFTIELTLSPQLTLEVADPETFSIPAAYFDTCRTERNQLSHGAPEGVTETDLDDMLRLVPEFERAV